MKLSRGNHGFFALCLVTRRCRLPQFSTAVRRSAVTAIEQEVAAALAAARAQHGAGQAPTQGGISIYSNQNVNVFNIQGLDGNTLMALLRGKSED